MRNVGADTEISQLQEDKVSSSSYDDEGSSDDVERRRKVTEASVSDKSTTDVQSHAVPPVDGALDGPTESKPSERPSGSTSFTNVDPKDTNTASNKGSESLSSPSTEIPGVSQAGTRTNSREPISSTKTVPLESEEGHMKQMNSYQSLEDALKHDSGQSARSSAEQPSSKTGSSETSSSNTSGEDPNAPPRVITVGVANEKKTNKKSKKLRRGKWTAEEEAYVARVIQDFNSGFLDAPAGTTLRTYLSEKLQCDPMRITKKFTGDSCIGKRVFHPAVRSPNNSATIDKAQTELASLEKRWRRRLEQQQRETAKKAAVSLGSVNGSGRGESPLKSGNTSGTRVIAKTASWLDRAKTVLKDPSDTPTLGNDDPLNKDDLMDKMHEVQKLLNEGSGIQQSSAGLPTLLENANAQQTGESSSDDEPVDKRPRTGAEDAEALVGFLRSVRASAANGAESRHF